MPPTIKDVAQYTGLSIATISKYTNGGNVLAQNRALIEEAIQSLGYKANHAARSLKTNKTRTIGILIPSLSSAFFSRIVAIIDKRLLKSGYNTVVCNYDNPTLEKAKLEFLVDANVDGIIMVAEGLMSSDFTKFSTINNHDIPLILVDRTIKDLHCDKVLVDNISASYTAVEYLIRRMHKHIGIITGPLDISSAFERMLGYRRVHEDYSLPIDESLIKVGNYDLESGYRLFLEMVGSPNPPTAMYVSNYDMMLGAITAAHERHISLPDQLDFIGHDNIELSRVISPSISIVVQPMDEIGETTADLMLQRLRGDYKSFPLVVRHKAQLFIPDQEIL